MKLKRLGYVLLLVMMAVCLLCITACGDDEEGKGDTPAPGHTHSYASTVTAPTCTEKGYTKHTCSCGDSYMDTYVDAGHKLVDVPAQAATCQADGYTAHKKCDNCTYVEGKTVVPSDGSHDYVVQNIQYPTATEPGSRELKCSDCNATVSETMDAFVTTMPDVAMLANEVLCGAKYTLDATDAELIMLTKENATVTDEMQIALKVAEVVLDGTGSEPVGHIKFEAGQVRKLDGEIDYEGEVALYLYLNGDAVSVEITAPDGSTQNFEIDINDEFYQALAESMGTDVESLATGYYMTAELSEYLPVVVGLFEELPTISADFITDLEELASLVGVNLVTEESDGNGNVVYTLDIAALKELLTLVEGKTLSEIIDDVYGEGSGDALLAFLGGIPDKKIGEIVDTAIVFTENYDIPVEDTYYLVNLAVRLAGGPEDFDIEAEIDSRYNMTVADLLAEMNGLSGADAEEFKTNFKNGITNFASQILDCTVNDLFAMMAPAEEPVDLFENIREILDMLDEAISVEIVIDEATQALVSMDFVVEYLGNTVSASVNENGGEFIVTDDGEVIAEVTVDITETANERTYVADMVIDGDDFLDFELSINDADGCTSMIFLVREDLYTEEWVYDPVLDDYYPQSVYYGFVPTYKLTYYAENNESEREFEYLIETFDVNEEDFVAIFGVGFECEDDDVYFSITVEDETLELYKENDEIGFTAIEDEEILAEGYIRFVEDATSYICTAAISVEDYSECVLDFIMTIDKESGEFTANLITRGEEYDPDTDTFEFGVMADVSFTGTFLEDGVEFTFVAKDGDGVEQARGTIALTAVSDGDTNGISVEFAITTDGDTVSGEYVMNVTALEDGGKLDRLMSVTFNGEEEFHFADSFTVSADLLAYEILFRADGDTMADAEFSVESTSDANKEIVIFSYDIAKFVTDTYWPDSATKVVSYLQGAGDFSLTIER